jgi:DNA-binding GntR family transcriptional regulator
MPKQTTAAVVHGQLRQAILSGKLPPGEWLRQEELAEELAVSRMPIRGALQLLGEEGLVEFIPHRGARVSPLSVEELEEIYAARMGLEGLAARYAAATIDGDTLDALRTALPRLTQLFTAGELDAYLLEDRRYMERFFAASGRQRLCRQIFSLRERAGRYLRLVFESTDQLEWLECSYRLFQACAANDSDLAEAAVQDALRWTLSQATPLLESYLADVKEDVDADG